MRAKRIMATRARGKALRLVIDFWTEPMTRFYPPKRPHSKGSREE